ncbi:MAG: glycerol kinase GlpK [Phenylobacterium sp.]
MPSVFLLSLDQGTTSTRAILFDGRGVEVASLGEPLAQHYPGDGEVEHDAHEIFSASVKVLRGVLGRAGVSPSQVAAIGITNQRETVVVWDRRTGEPVGRALVWQDRRTAPECEALRAQGVETGVTALTGLLLDPYFSATKLAWILDSQPGLRARAEAGELLAGTMDTWVIWKLTGGAVHATDATNASRTLLFDIHAQDWSDELLGLFRVPRALLPRVMDCADDYGSTLPELLGGAIAIRGVAGDQQAALMGQGCIRPGEMKATYGTGCFLLLNTGEMAARSSARLLTTVAARLEGRSTYALEGSIFVAGAALQWVNEGLGVPGGGAEVEALARRARPGHGVTLVPAFTGLGAPWWDPDARAGLLGMTRDTGLPEIADAAFEAAAFQTRDLIEAMRLDAPEAFGPDAELRVDGGMSRSAWFCQKLADRTRMPVGRAAYEETTALGAALFAGLGCGLFATAADAASARPQTTRLAPQGAAGSADNAYAAWLRSVSRIRSDG